MQFDQLTPELFDKTAEKWFDETHSGLAAVAEDGVICDLREESRICGHMARHVLELLKTSGTVGEQRRVLSGLFGLGIRYGWNLRRILHEREALQGMLPETEVEMLRREIREAS